MRSGIPALFAVVALCVLTTTATVESARAIYVDDDAAGAGSGSSWADACKYLQDALTIAAEAAKPVEIRVAGGTYRPDQGAGIVPGDQTATFRLLNGVTLKGGFAGATAPDPNACDPEQYETVLSGDLNSNDGPDLLSQKDNSCHVVLGALTDESAVIDGFIVMGGGAPWGPCDGEFGSDTGILIDGGAPLLRRCRFMANYRQGVFARNGSSPTLVECTLDGMYVFESDARVFRSAFSGEGLTGNRGSKVSLENCVFDKASVQLLAGSDAALMGCGFTDCERWAMTIQNSNSVLTDCVFRANGGGPLPGGAIQCNGSTLTLTGCRFLENDGPAIDGVNTGSLDLTRCSFIGNTSERGSTVSIDGSAVLRDCEFIGNSARWSPGALSVTGDQLRATGCVFAGNSAIGGYHAGAIFSQTALLHLSHCTFTGNRGRPSTSLHWQVDGVLQAEITHCIIWDGPEPFGPVSLLQTPITITWCDIQGGYPGKGNIDIDPRFVDPGRWVDPTDPAVELGPQVPDAVWMTGDYHLKSQAGHWDQNSQTWVRDEGTSPCIDAGDPNAPLGVELFPNGGIINLGAYGGSAAASRSYFGDPVCETQIAGDINGDCKVDSADLAILMSHWLTDGTVFVNAPPTVTLLGPEDGATFEYPTPVILTAHATDGDGSVLKVKFVYDRIDQNGRRRGSLADSDPSDGWRSEWRWWSTTGALSDATCIVWAEAMDDDGAVTASPKIAISLVLGAP